MLTVARKNLLRERTRLAISVGGVTLSVFLIGILLSLYRGWDETVGEYVENVPADLWVASEGSTDFIYAASLLPGTLEMIKAGAPSRESFDMQLVGYDPEAELGGPLRVVEGKSPPGPDEVVIDKVLSE